MKILYIIDSLRSGGKERRMVSLIDRLATYDDIQMELVIQSEEIHYKSILESGIKINKISRNLKQDIRIISKFNIILNSFKPDIVHCWDTIAAMHFAPVCKIKKIPFINSMITAAPFTTKLSKRYFSNVVSYPFSDVILSNSQAGLDNLFVPLKKQKVIYNGFNFNRIRKLKDKELVLKEFNIKGDKPIIGMVASFTVRKDYPTLLKTASLLNDTYSFVTIGDGECLEQMKSLAIKLDIKNIHFLGKQQDVESIVNVFDIGILLSNPSEHGEGISNSIIEYMALEKPVIASKGGGTAELVLDKITGFLIEPKNPEQLAEKINFLTTNNEIAKQLGQNGKQRIKEFFSIDKMVSETYELYLKNLNN